MQNKTWCILFKRWWKEWPHDQGCNSSSFKGTIIPVTSYRHLKSNTFQLQGTCSKNFNSNFKLQC